MTEMLDFWENVRSNLDWKAWICIFAGVPVELLVALIQQLGKLAADKVDSDVSVSNQEERRCRTGLFEEFHHLSKLLGTTFARSIRIVLLAPSLPLLLVIKYIIRCCTCRSTRKQPGQVRGLPVPAPKRDEFFSKLFPIMAFPKFKDGLGTVVFVACLAVVAYSSWAFQFELGDIFEKQFTDTEALNLNVYQSAVIIWLGGAIVMLIPGVPVFLVGSITTKVISKYFPKNPGDETAEVQNLWVGCLIATAALTGAKFTANFIEYLIALNWEIPFMEEKIADAGHIAKGMVRVLGASSKTVVTTIFCFTRLSFTSGVQNGYWQLLSGLKTANTVNTAGKGIAKQWKPQRWLILLLLPINFYWMYAFMRGPYYEHTEEGYEHTEIDFYLKAIDYLILIAGHVAFLVIIGRMMPPSEGKESHNDNEINNQSQDACCKTRCCSRIRYAMSFFAACLSICAFWLTVIVVQTSWERKQHDWKYVDDNGKSEARLFGIALLLALACFIQFIVSWWDAQKITSVFNCVCSLLSGAAAFYLCDRRKKTKDAQKLELMIA